MISFKNYMFNKRIFCTFFVFILILSVTYNTPVTVEANEYDDKISEELNIRLDELNNDDLIDIYVYFNESDIEQEAYELMESRYPEEYRAYIEAKFDDLSDDTIPTINSDWDAEMIDEEPEDPEYADIIQRAIELKRSVNKDLYETKKSSILKKYTDDISILFLSSYTPMSIVSVSKETILDMAKDNDIAFLDLFIDYELSTSSLQTANLTTRASYVRDTYGNKGAGVKIGQIEPSLPDTSNSDLSGKIADTSINFDYSLNADDIAHATIVAKIMVGSNNGVAPLASLYCVGCQTLSNHYLAIEWLIDHGVNVINMSTNAYDYKVYDDLCAFVDHIASHHDVHYVVSAGNKNDYDSTLYIVSPGLSYNAITVGNFSDNGTGPANDSEINTYQHDDYLYGTSRYNESINSNRPEKPNLVAPGNSFLKPDGMGSLSGTSFSAPQVTGVIAQLCSYRSALKTKQSCMGAILEASCGRKLSAEVQANTEIVTSSGFKGGKFTSTASVTNSNFQISNKQGAGKLDARWARSIALSGNYWSYSISGSTSSFNKYVNITASSNTLTRIAIFVLKRNSGCTHSSISQIPMPNWNLTVYDPGGNVVGSSLTSQSNYEIVQFAPTVSGSYRIELSREGNYSEISHIGLAVW